MLVGSNFTQRFGILRCGGDRTLAPWIAVCLIGINLIANVTNLFLGSLWIGNRGFVLFEKLVANLCPE